MDLGEEGDLLNEAPGNRSAAFMVLWLWQGEMCSLHRLGKLLEAALALDLEQHLSWSRKICGSSTGEAVSSFLGTDPAQIQ